MAINKIHGPRREKTCHQGLANNKVLSNGPCFLWNMGHIAPQNLILE